MPTHYETLGLAPPPATINAVEIRAAYRRLARKLHPDVDPSPDAARRFAELAAAYEILADPARRAEYDRELAIQRSSASRPGVPHYTWSNVAAPPGGSGSADRSPRSAPDRGPRRPTSTEADDIYDTFFTRHPSRPPKADTDD